MTNINTDNTNTIAQNNVAEAGGGLVGLAASDAAKDAMAGTQEERAAIIREGEFKATVQEIEGAQKAQAVSDTAHNIGEGIREFPEKVADTVKGAVHTVASIPGKVADAAAAGVATVVEKTGDAAASVKEHIAENRAEATRAAAVEEARVVLDSVKADAQARVDEVVDHARKEAEVVYTDELSKDGTLASDEVPAHVDL